MPADALSTIQSALNTHLQAYAQTADLPVAWEGVDAAVDPGQPYLRPWLLPAPVRTAGIGRAAMNRHLGVFQVDVLCRAGEGWGDASAIADGLIHHFRRDTEFPIRKFRMGNQERVTPWRYVVEAK